MEIRPVAPADLEALAEIDATIESNQYLHLDRTGEDLNISWKLEQRSLRTKLIESNPFTDELRFIARQIATGADEGIALTVEHETLPVALLLAQPRPARGTIKLIDLRVDSDHRRQGLATGMMYQLIQTARDAGNTAVRAVTAEAPRQQFPR